MERENYSSEELKKEYQKPELKKLDIKNTEASPGGVANDGIFSSSVGQS